ncbi:fibronectin type III domain-containing protein 7-like [Hypanus sabinus]|uniref:fibronectin type III domain-containing protein 7-like n=1 Tax=Hypanus sabinus TaxID=79690 RepID=UPI0028C437B8|nr:fibronectin type III domain-containing protein 7-like [Hypanus sabinus]
MAEGIEGDKYACNATEANCEIAGLPCGQTYNVTVLAMDENCTSLSSPAFEIQTAPCIPQNVVAHINCENNTVSVFWDASNGSESYHVTAQGTNGHWASCNTTGTECEVSDVYCGLYYYVTVQAVRMGCNSSQSSALTVKTVPCVPQNVDAYVDCDSGHMSVSWEFCEGASSYIATADGGDMQQCSANDTLCDITDLSCGETYTVTVLAHDDTCDSAESPSITTRTVSCIPQNLDVHLDCDTNDASVLWSHTKGAVSYSATVEGSDGHPVSCETANTECQITNLHCGQVYNLTVRALDGVCDSSQSSQFEFSTVPCAPDNISINLDCDTKSTSVTWAKAEGALWYITTAEGQDEHVSLCNTTETSCDFVDLHCSHTYSITVKAMDAYCQSINASVFETKTAPCPPQNVQADCAGVTAFVSWEPSNLTLWYTATAEGSDGHIATCTTSETNCLIPDLHCSQTYNITVLAFGETCSSLRSSHYGIHTAPCAPDEIIANVDCNSNRVVVSWGTTGGATSFGVTAEGSDGHIHSHNTTETRHEMLDLHCGQSYNITITTLSYGRHGISSTSVQIQTAPCIPENLTAELNCDLNTISFWWDETAGAKLYTVTVRDSQRVTALFNTSDTRAQIQDLQCGEYYTISVLATDDICRRPQTAVVNVHSVPCDPQNVKVQLDCNLNTALVLWDYSEGALWYTAIAEGADGGNISCSTSETSCRTPMLRCGQLYSVYVVASDRTCNHSLSSAVEIQTAPCSPQNVSAHLDCGNHTTSVWWEESEGAVYYTAMAEGVEGEDYSCNTTGTNCEIVGLPCGQMFNITVLAMDENCTSLPSPAFEIQTVPCIPQNAVAHINCENNTVSVFWDASNGSESYHVTAQGTNGHWASCNTTGTECEVSDVYCGLYYYVTVQAVRMGCNSSQSSALAVKTVPCVPQNVDAYVDCDSGHISVSWEFCEGASSYIASADGGDMQQCSANDTLCDITDLSCGETYTVTVLAHDDTCDSAESPSITTRTVPCIPQNLDVHLDCDTNDVSVLWSHTKGAVSYSATVEGSDGHPVSCETANTECQITNLHCGQVYNLTVTALDGVCDTSQSSLFAFSTAPCAPEPISTSLDCDTRSTSVTWAKAEGALWYITTAEGQDGHVSRFRYIQ